MIRIWLLSGNIIAIPEEITLSEGNVIASGVQIPEQWELEFDAYISASSSEGWVSLIHFTTGENWVAAGSRVPGVWYHMTGELICVAETETNFDARVHLYENLADKWITIRMMRKLADDGTYPYFCYVDDELIGTIPNTDLTPYTVTVYASDPWHGVDNARMKNLRFAGKSNEYLETGM